MLTYAGKRVVVCGCRSGIGYEVTRLLLEHGAEVVGLDVAATPLPVHEFVQLDLGDEPTIAAAVDAVPGPIDALFVTSAVPHKTNPGIRLNCTAPGAVDTEAMNASAVETGDPIAATIGSNPKPVEQAWPLLFLNSEGASCVNGQILWTEQGMMNAALTGQLDLAAAYPGADDA